MQITSKPATIAISVNHNNYTNQCIEKSNKFAVSVLSINSDSSIIGTFGFKSGKDVNKFESVKYNILDELPVLADCCAYIICEVINKMETDTHTVFLGKVLNAEI
jgi:flavin reductase (DIM6/NTAB) family NADH-FMN oxidoreductase RutF